MFRGSIIDENKSVDQSKLSQTRVYESQGDTLHKEIESYTRKFEEEKRKLFRAQENQREVLKEYQNQVADLQGLKTKKYQTEVSTLNAKIKYLEINLEKGINAYNQALSRNNSLKTEIDELRKQKKNQQEAYRTLVNKIEEYNSSIKTMDQSIVTKKNKVEKTKEQILKVREKNQKQNNDHIHGIDELKKSAMFSSSIKQTMKNIGNKQATEASDTQPIVKLRIKNLIHSNKEKIKIADMYKKSMEKIQQSFLQIKQESGISDLQQITKTFLKQQEQNTFIFEYINKLTNELQGIREQNQHLAGRIAQQEQQLSEKRKLLSGTPEQQKSNMKLQKYYADKQLPINKLTSFLAEIEPELLAVLNINKGNEQNLLSYFNIEQFLALLEEKIDEKYSKNKQEVTSTEVKDNFTKYSKAAPVFDFEQVRQRAEQNILQQGKFRDFACDYWQRKKQVK